MSDDFSVDRECLCWLNILSLSFASGAEVVNGTCTFMI
jgi:hypothetical protein